jgi:hypothetical protein
MSYGDMPVGSETLRQRNPTVRLGVYDQIDAIGGRSAA